MRSLNQVIANGKKRCSQCGQFRDISEFGRMSQAPSGLAYACKACTGERDRIRYVPVPRTTAVPIVDGKKSCSKCKRLLPVSDFHKHSQTASGLASACKACTSESFKRTYVPITRMTAIQIVDGKKPCSKCKQLLPLSDYGMDSGTPTGLAYKCKVCAAEDQRAKRNRDKAKDPEGYLAAQRASQRLWRDSAHPDLRKARGRRGNLKSKGVTADWYEAKLVEQGGVCAICKLPESKLSSGGGVKMLAVDHNHTTGKPRGLLCQQCNIGIGALRDSPELIRKASVYLVERRWEEIAQSV